MIAGAGDEAVDGAVGTAGAGGARGGGIAADVLDTRRSA